MNSVPLKPHVDSLAHPDWYESMKESVCSGKHMIPECIQSLDISSNPGLIKVLRAIMDEMDAQRPKRYRLIICDCNIFNRLMKVCMFYRVP